MQHIPHIPGGTNIPVRLPGTMDNLVGHANSPATGSDHSVSKTIRSYTHTSIRPHPRRSRAKKSNPWEIADRNSGGKYSANLGLLMSRFKGLSPAELRVAALVMAMLKNYEIAEKLCIDEKTVENHRNSIRRKLDLKKESLVCHLTRN